MRKRFQSVMLASYIPTFKIIYLSFLLAYVSLVFFFSIIVVSDKITLILDPYHRIKFQAKMLIRPY